MLLRRDSSSKNVGRSVRAVSWAARDVVEALEARVLLAGSGLAGAYYNNASLSGSPVATRIDQTVNFNWLGTPGVTGIGSDNFSVRWTGQVTPRFTGAYRFLTNSDDGVRLYVNGQRIIDNWTVHAPTLNSGTVNLTAGVKANVTMEFFEAGAGAVAQLMWESASQPREIIPASQLSNTYTPPTQPTAGTGDGLRGTYFDNENFTTQKFTRVDPQVNFNWGTGSPASSIAADTFSVRWTGQMQAQKSETYTFYTRSDDGVRLTVNGRVLIDKLVTQAPTEHAGSIALVAGQKYNIQLDYIERTGGAMAQLSWASPTTAKQLIPKSQLYSGTTTVTTPATPAGLTATALSSSQIRLNWQDVANETLYKLERSPDGVSGWTQIATPAANATSHTDSNLAASTKYFYRLRANNSAGDSGYTAVVSATTQGVPTGGNYRPDQVIQIHKETSFVGDNVYNTTGAGQNKAATDGFYGTVFKIRVFNDGSTADSFVITGPAADKDWRVAYYDSHNFGWDGGRVISDAVTGGGWNTGVLQPGQWRDYRIELLGLDAPGGTTKTFAVTARSAADASKVDVVTATLTAPVVRGLSWRRQNFGPGGVYLMKIENQGNLPDQFRINTTLGAGFGSTWNVQFFDDQWGGNDVTGAVRSGGGWTTRVLQPYESQEFRVVFSGYSDPNVPNVQLTAASVGKTDTRETLTVTVGKPEDRPAPSDLFPIGVWTQPMSSFDKWKGRGVNTLVGYQGDGATMEQWSQAARNRGMYYIRDALPRDRRHLDAADKNLLAWALPDEPEITTRYPAETLKTWIDDWKQTDPNKPIWANFSGGYVLRWQGNVAGPSGYKPYQDLTDWDSSSIYPVTGWSRPQEHPGLDAPGRSVDQLEKWSNGDPQFAVIEPSDQELNWIARDIPGPNPGQFRAEVWDSIISGARGVIYFPMSFKPSFRYDNTAPELVAEMTATNAKIQSLARVLQSDIDPPSRGLDAQGPLKGTWRVLNGKTYYVVLNFSNQAVTRSMTFHGIGGVSTASVHGENRSVSLANGSFTDTFGAYSVHVYEVPAAPSVPPPPEGDGDTPTDGGTTTGDDATSGGTTAALAPAPSPAFATTRIGLSALEKEDESSFDARVGA